MRRSVLLAGSLAVLVTLGATSARAVEPFEVASDGRLRVEWETATRKSTPIIRGYVFNSYGVPAANVRIMAEAVDASGNVTSKHTGWVFGMVPNDNRSYFEIKVPAAPDYRVRVISYDWVKGGGP